MSTADSSLPTPRLAIQALSLVVARVVAFVIALGMPLVVVRALDSTQFGLYRLAIVAATTASAILPFSVGASAFYYLPRLTDYDRKALILNIVAYHLIVGIAVIVVLAIWPGLLIAAVGNRSIVPFSGLIGVMVATIVFSGFFELVATANQDVRQSTLFIVIAQASRAAFIILAATLFRSVQALLYAWILQGALQSIALLWYLNHRFPRFWCYRSRALAFEQMRYVVPFGIAGLLVVVQLEAHNYIVAHYVDTTQFAVYAVGTTSIPFIGILRESVNSVMQSRMSKLQKCNDHEGMLQLTMRAWRTLAFVLLPTFVFLTLLSPDFIAVLYTPKYLASVPVFRVNALLLVTSIFITDAVVRSFSELRFWLLKVRLVLVVGQLLLSVLLVPAIGMAGALAAMCVVMLIDRAISIARVFWILEISRRHLVVFREIGVILIISLSAGIITAGALAVIPVALPLPRLISGSLVFSVAYASMIAVCGVLDQGELAMISQVKAAASGIAAQVVALKRERAFAQERR